MYDVWFDGASPKDVVEACRKRVLEEIAGAMVQLDRFSFDKRGVGCFW